MVQAACVAVGAAVGALLRWQLGLRLNAPDAALPWGTLLANLIGALLIGGLLALGDRLPVEWRLLLITGFLGGLTTFSSFSAETVLHMQQGRWATVGWMLLLHVGGSLLLTGLGAMAVMAALAARG